MRSLDELSSLHERVVLIAGGAGHVGMVLGDTFEELGARVAVTDIAPLADDPARASRQWQYQVDLRAPGAAHQVTTAVMDAFGRLDVLVHCAAYVGTTRRPGWAVPLEEQTAEACDEALGVNVTTAFALAQAARPHLARSGRGAILFVSSIYGLVAPDPALYAETAMVNPAAYGASKAALDQLARYLATAYAPRIRVNTLAPGGISRGQPAAFVERYERRTPLRRMATEEDLKGAAAFLASDLSAYVTGHTLVVDGGWTTW